MYQFFSKGISTNQSEQNLKYGQPRRNSIHVDEVVRGMQQGREKRIISLIRISHFEHMSTLTPKHVGKSNAEQYKPVFTDRRCNSGDIMRLAQRPIAYTAYDISHTVDNRMP
jgi:hypothetical protein